MKSIDYKKEYWKQYSSFRVKKNNAKVYGDKEPDIVETLLNPLEPKIRAENGKINWIWVLFNIGKIVARLLLATDIKKGLAKENISSPFKA